MLPWFSSSAVKLFFLLALSALALTPSTYAYFVVKSPTKDADWVNGEAYSIEWSKGLMDGVNMFDLELARMSTSGLIFAAKNVNAKLNSINIALNDVPAANDYYLLFLNSTHGILYASSSQFSILPSGQSPSGNATKPDSNRPTVTVSGGPNPTAAFATTFAASSAITTFPVLPTHALCGALLAALFGVAYTAFL